MKENLGIIIFLCILIGIGIFRYGTRRTYQKTIDTLASIDASHVTGFSIYPKTTRPSGIPVIVRPPDPMIGEFFQALTDVRRYPASRDTVAQEQAWFLEISTAEGLVQIACYVPFQKGNIVVGGVGKFTTSGGGYTTEFQSDSLYQWYQKYKHRWVKSPVSSDESTHPTIIVNHRDTGNNAQRKCRMDARCRPCASRFVALHTFSRRNGGGNTEVGCVSVRVCPCFAAV